MSNSQLLMSSSQLLMSCSELLTTAHEQLMDTLIRYHHRAFKIHVLIYVSKDKVGRLPTYITNIYGLICVPKYFLRPMRAFMIFVFFHRLIFRLNTIYQTFFSNAMQDRTARVP